MTTWVGRSIAHYRVTAQIGAGGMGEVYRASDPRLGRDVAIKVLPPEFVDDHERMARFEREAKLLASLSHTNVAGIFGLEETNGTRALVMEMVEGPTLADRIAAGALPPDEALPIARQIAEALEYAHERGIIHRDLKPANVKLTPDGVVKVLDFGLAKALSDDPAASGAELSKSPTLTAASTRLGVILGTAAYMSPEQAKGKAVDRRADIWAFGALLFEMLTGRQAFAGETVSETLASVMKDEPEWGALPASTPARMRDLMRRCLVKEPRQRLRDIGEARIRIEEEMFGAPETLPSAGTPARARRRWIGLVTAAGVAVAAAVAGMVAGYRMRTPPPPPPVYRAALTFPDGMVLDEQNASVAISPDGLSVVLAAAGKDQGQKLWLRRFESGETTAIAGTDGATYPFWSPDGRFIGFFADRKLKRTPASGGVVQTICDAVDGRGASWSRDGMIAFSPGPLSGLQLVPAAGGAPKTLTTLETTGETHRLPCFLPDGKRLLFVVGSANAAEGAVDCLDIESKKRTRVMESRSGVRYLSDYLAYVRDNDLVVQRFDPSSLALSGEPIPLADAVQFNPYRYSGGYDLCEQGPLVYLSGRGDAGAQLTWFDLDGKEQATVGGPRPIFQFALSPDGGRVMTAERTERVDLWMVEVATGVRTRFSFGPAPGAFPCWTPDSKNVYFADGAGSVLVKPADGASPARTVFQLPNNAVWPEDLSPDGKLILLSPQLPETGVDIWVKPVDGDAEPEKVAATPANEQEARFSPNGRWIALSSDESGRTEVVVIPYPTLTGRWQVSTQGGRSPRWLPDGRGIIYMTEDRHLVQVDVDTGGLSFGIGAQKALFGGRVAPELWALAPDGTRILALVPEGGAALSLDLVTDWRRLVKARAAE